MIIRKYDGSVWQEQYPKTTQNMIYDSGSVTTALFDSNKKLKVAYLPDAVFDSLLFYSTLSGSASQASFLASLDGALYSAENASRSLKGSYFVINASGSISQLTSGTQASVSNFSPAPYFTYVFSNADSQAGSTTSSGTMEVGDWVVVEKITGSGTSGSPYALTLSVVNNTYEVMTGADGSNAGASGLVPQPGATDNVKFLRGDGTFATPTDTNTTYSAGTLLDLSGTTFNVDLTELSASTSAINGLQDHLVYIDNGVQKKILFSNVSNAAFSNGAGYTTNVGDITSVTAGTGLSGGGTAGDVSLNVDLSELTDMTATAVGDDEFILLDASASSADRRKRAAEIGLSIFSNDAGFTTNVGDITAVVAGEGLTGGATSGSATLTLEYPVYWADTQAALPTDAGVPDNAIGFEF